MSFGMSQQQQQRGYFFTISVQTETNKVWERKTITMLELLMHKSFCTLNAARQQWWPVSLINRAAASLVRPTRHTWILILAFYEKVQGNSNTWYNSCWKRQDSGRLAFQAGFICCATKWFVSEKVISVAAEQLRHIVFHSRSRSLFFFTR